MPTTFKAHLLKLASIGNIKKDKACEIINQVMSATQKWHEFAVKSSVSTLQTKNIGETLARINKSIANSHLLSN